MARIDTLQEAQQVAHYIQSRPDLDPQQRADLMSAMREFDARQQAAPQPPTAAPGAGFQMPTQAAVARGVAANAMSAGHALANVYLDIAELSTLAGQSLSRDRTPEAEAYFNRARTGVRDARSALTAQALRGLEAATGYKDFPGLGQFIGETLAFSGARLGAGWWSAALKGGAEGAAAGALGAVADSESLGDLLMPMTYGGLLSAGLSAGLLSGMGTVHYAARKYDKALNSEIGKRAMAVEREVRSMTGDNDFAFTVGQLAADNPWLASLEIGSAQKAALERQVKTIRTLEKFVLNKFQSSKSPQDVIIGLHGTVNKLATKMQTDASDNFRAGLSKLIDDYGDQVVVDARAYRGALIDYIQEFQQKKDLGLVKEVPPVLQSHLKAVTDLVFPYKAASRITKDANGKAVTEWIVRQQKTGKIVSVAANSKAAMAEAGRLNSAEGGLNIEQTQTLIKTFNEFMGGQIGAFDEASGALGQMSRVLKAKFMQSLDGQSSGAVTALRNLNKLYAFDESKIDALRQSVLGAVFGSKEALPGLLQNPRAAMSALIRQSDSPEAMAATRKLLATHAPDLLDDIKGVFLQQVVQSSRRAGTPSSRSRMGAGSEIDLESFAEALSGPGLEASAGRVGLGLFTPQEQNQLIKAGQALQILNNTFLQRQMVDAAGRASDIGINLVSRSSEFMTRLLVRIVSKGRTIEQLMVDPSARELMIELSKKKPDSTAFKAAAAALAYRVGAAEAASEAEDILDKPQFGRK